VSNYAPESYGLKREDESVIAGTFAPCNKRARTLQKKLLVIKTSK
jgi:hypothetical protein